MDTLPETSAERRFRAFRHDLVRQLARRSGPFWEAVRELRAAWDVSASCHVPPGRSGVFLPPACDGIDALDPYDESPQAWKLNCAYQGWMNHLYALHETAIPEEYLIGCGFRGYWSTDASFEHWARFLSACVLYDPPPDALVAFADAFPHGPWEWLDPDGPSVVFGEALVAPEIRHLRDGDEVQRLEMWYRHRVIQALAERLEPRGVDVWGLVRDIEANTSLGEEY